MNLNKEQYIAAKHVNGPMLVLAGPGSGKTHLLVERIRMMIEDEKIMPEHILVITFSKKAAVQMQARFLRRVEKKNYPVTFGTFHAVFYGILRDHDPNIRDLVTQEQQERLVRCAIKKRDLSGSSLCKDFDTDVIVGLIGAYKNFGKERFVQTGPGKEMTMSDLEDLGMICEEYNGLCRAEGVIDFDDMVLLCRDVLYKHESVLRKWKDRYRYILVDEFQDINDGQYDVLRLLAGDTKNVFAVGDDDQSIYAFRGARPHLMKKFIHQYTGCRRVTLTMNYRCCENVIGAADAVIRHNIERLERPMQRHLPSKAGGTVMLINSENTDVQAVYVCDMIEDLIAKEGYEPRDIAVLYRSGHCAKRFIAIAQERGFDLRMTGKSGAIPKQFKIHEAYMRAKNSEATRADMFLIMNNPPRELSRESLCACSCGDYIRCMNEYYKNDPGKLEAVRDLENTIKNYNGCYEKPDRSSNTKDMINVMTAHASKGLEFKCVFIIGLQEGLFPHHRDMEGNAEEERRLMYVAMTRAIERLYMCTVSTAHGKRASRFAGEAVKKKEYISDILRLTRI